MHFYSLILSFYNDSPKRVSSKPQDDLDKEIPVPYVFIIAMET